MPWISTILNVYKILATQNKTDCKASQDKESAREEIGAGKVEINWNNCFLQQWICYRYYGYSQQNHFAESTIASLNQLLHYKLMWNHDILDLQWICALQVRKLWWNSVFASPNMKACLLISINWPSLVT